MFEGLGSRVEVDVEARATVKVEVGYEGSAKGRLETS